MKLTDYDNEITSPQDRQRPAIESCESLWVTCHVCITRLQKVVTFTTQNSMGVGSHNLIHVGQVSSKTET